MKALVLVAVAMLALSARVGAEIAVLAGDATLKVTSWRAEGEVVYLSLKGGGELGLPAGQLRGVVPDEVLEEVEPARDPQELRRLATDAARRHGLDPELVLAVVAVESAFRADAVSPKGAQGLMQLMPRTASALGVQDAFDPEDNLDGGTRHLSNLLALHGGDLKRALAAYNAGAGAVARHGGLPPYRETLAYVRKVLERYGRSR